MNVINYIYPQFFDNDGVFGEDGNLYFGTENLNPETNPISIYWDSEGTTPAAQLVKTVNGLICRNGTPSDLYVNQTYSLTVKDKNFVLVYYKPSSAQSSLSNVAQVVTTIAGLRALPKNGNSRYALVTGYYASGDGGGGNYWLDINDTTSVDNGGTIIVADDGGRWFMTNIQSLTFEQFGAKGDGATDDTAALQATIDAAGGTYAIRPPSNRNYNITDTLTIGNGSVSAPSTIHGVAIIGSGAGITGSEFGGGYSNTKITWSGASSATMIKIAGPIFGVNLEGLTLDCNNLASTGIEIMHLCDSQWQNILVEKYIGTAYKWLAYSAPTGVVVGASGSTFINVSAKRPGTNGNGGDFGQSTGDVGNLDVARNTWISCEFWRDFSSLISYSMKLQFIDNCTFIECTTSPGGGSGVSMLIAPPAGSGVTGFPAALTFINCPITGPGIAADGSWAANEGFQFWPYPVGDGEVIPITPIFGQCYGVTTKNEYFGGIKIGIANPAISAHYSVTGALTFGAVSANSYADQAINVPGCLLGDTVLVASQNNSSYVGGLQFTGHVSANGTVIVRCFNCTTSPQTPTAGVTYRIDVWQH